MNKETVKALIGTIVTTVIAIASTFGFALDDGIVERVVAIVVLIVVTVYACWKNRNFTKAAQKGQELTNEIKESLKVEGGEV